MQDKKTLITIIVLLVIFLPAAILGTWRSMKTEPATPNEIDENPNRDLIYNNQVYFYYNNELLGTYECSNCSQTKTVIDDDSYHTNYYANGTYELPAVLNESVALINQNGTDYVYSISVGRTISSFSSIKDYHIEHTEPILIVKYNGNWGVLSITTQALIPIISYSYEYISLPAHLIDGKLDTSKFIAMRNNYWYIINRDGSSDYPAKNAEIVDFNDNYYITYDNNYHIYDYNDQEYLSSLSKRNVFATKDYIIILNSDNSLSIYENLNSNELERIMLPAYTSIYFDQTTSGVNIIIDGNLYQTIE